MASDKKIINRYGKIADQILALAPEMEKLKNEDFVSKTQTFKDRLAQGESVDNLLVEAYAVAREAANRTLGLNAYRVQLIGAIILNAGDIAEMRTGEGKTLVGLFPAYLNALTGKGVHIVTVNEYLSKRDSELNGQVFDLLGITVGLNGSRLPKPLKRLAYSRDITYTTNSELGFDYLRDNMVQDPNGKVQRELNYAIIDEADSVLIDEARTPLIISGGSTNRINMYLMTDKFAKKLKIKEDVDLDLESKQVFLNEQGMQKAKEFFSLDNLFDVNNTELFHLIMNALKANFTFKEGVEYTVKDNEIVLIDQFTGRIMEGRAYSDGLQQALQAKENVKIEEETTTLATITYQNFYRLYAKLAGMTGTAKTEEEEFIKIYNTRVIMTPTNKPVIRKDETDLTFGTKHAALKKLIADVIEINNYGNPILIGTTSVESSEQIARYLEKAGLKFEMINAKNHAREADIVAKAGQVGAITLSTNMAGRGTDIKLAPEVIKIGGLVVFGVERNEARRIDNQLRGRSGRQGDPGRSRFYISMEDEMMVRFTSPKMRQNFKRLGEDHIKSKMFTRAVTNAQKKLEGMNFDQRKDVLDYDNILAQQREAMYSQRDDILFAPDLKVVLKKLQLTVAYELILEHSTIVRGQKAIAGDKLLKAIDGLLVPHNAFSIQDFEGKENMELAQEIAEQMMNFYTIRIEDVPSDVVHNMERKTILESFDRYWTKHIDVAGKLRSGIYLQQYAQNNPLAAYVEEATTLFNRTKIEIAREVVDKLAKVVIKSVDAPQPEAPKPITITDQDIDAILTEVGLEKHQLNQTTIDQRFAQLIAENQGQEKKLKKLKMQHDILTGLILELERRFKQNQKDDQQKTIEIGNQEIEMMAKSFKIKNLANFSVEEVSKGYQELMEKTDSHDKPTLLRLNLANQILTRLSQELSLIKTQKQTLAKVDDEYIIENESTDDDKKRLRHHEELEVTQDREEVVAKAKIG